MFNRFIINPLRRLWCGLFPLPSPDAIRAEQLREAELGLVDYEHRLEQVQAAIAMYKATIQRTKGGAA